MNQSANSITLNAANTDENAAVLTPLALEFLQNLADNFHATQQQLLEKRRLRQKDFDLGNLPDFLPGTRHIREDTNWKIALIPKDLLDRRVEITGPTDPKMVINALNSQAMVFMACLEDATSPTFNNLIHGQLTLKKANEGTLSFKDSETGKHYSIHDNPAVLIARPRGLHLPEKHLLYGKQPFSASLMDFGLYAFHNAHNRLQQGSGLYYYIPKLESHLEARWWNDLFQFTEQALNLPKQSIKATVLIETLPAVFEMEEILYEMKDYIVGMNCGRWDYVFSYIKTLKSHPDRILPDRQQVTMDKPFLNAYSRLLIHTCHKRGAFAMGGMSACIPSKDPKVNEEALKKVRQDKEQEASNGHDGTWVAHPGLVNEALQIFDQYLPKGQTHQLHILREEDHQIHAAELLEPAEGEFSQQNLKSNVEVAISYLAAWLGGKGCVPINGLMEDTATCEIIRASLWQMINHEVTLDNDLKLNRERFRALLADASSSMEKTRSEDWDKGHFGMAVELLDQLTTAKEFPEFLTLCAYHQLD